MPRTVTAGAVTLLSRTSVTAQSRTANRIEGNCHVCHTVTRNRRTAYQCTKCTIRWSVLLVRRYTVRSQVDLFIFGANLGRKTAIFDAVNRPESMGNILTLPDTLTGLKRDIFFGAENGASDSFHLLRSLNIRLSNYDCWVNSWSTNLLLVNWKCLILSDYTTRKSLNNALFHTLPYYAKSVGFRAK